MLAKESFSGNNRTMSDSLNTAVPSPYKATLDRVIASFNWAWLDTRCRYRRSVIGPFWETINIGVTIIGMSYMSSAIFGGHLAQNLPYIGLGIILWSMLLGLVNEGASCFISHRDLIKNTQLTVDSYVGHVIFKVLIISAHHMVLYLIGVVLLGIPVGPQTLMALVGVGFLILNAYWVVPVLAMLCARFRDLEMIVRNFMQMVFFVTPVFWNYHTMDPARHFIIQFNPFFYFLEAIRAPLLGESLPISHYEVLAAITVVGYALFYLIYHRSRRSLAFYV